MGEYYTDQLLPLALSFGMSSMEFWEEDPALLWSYYLAYKQKTEQDALQMDMNAWLQGSYVYEGVSAVLSNALGGKGGKKMQYPVNPRSLERQQHYALNEEEQLALQQQEMSIKIKAMHSNLSGVPKFQERE